MSSRWGLTLSVPLQAIKEELGSLEAAKRAWLGARPA
jgi:hypothetical protein